VINCGRLNCCKITCKIIIFQDNVNFDTYTMRDHLIRCIESQQFSPFPKTKPTGTKVLSLKNTSVNFSIEKECTARCNLPNLFEDMVCCDICSAWYHYGCVPINNSNTFSGSLSFTCSNCIFLTYIFGTLKIELLGGSLQQATNIQKGGRMALAYTCKGPEATWHSTG
jgi:hypothetical protein